MSVFDLHPEDLLDREAAGELLEHERALLDAHVHHCAACRLERKVRLDFAADLDADLPSHTGMLVTRALESQRPPAVLETTEKQAPNQRSEKADETGEEVADDDRVARVPSYRARVMRRRMGAAIIAAAVLMLASVAVAARGSQVWSAIFTPAPVEEEAPADTKTPETPKKQARKVINANHANKQDDVNQSDDETLPTESPIVTVVAPTACAPLPAPIAPVIAPRVAHVDDSPATAFQEANTARRRGDHVAAARLYRDLIDKHATSAEAPAARIALGRMLLDDGNADGALTLFSGYLAGGDSTLREEAMDGRARALERTHRADEERAAWNELLATYPASIHKAHAEARLSELTAH